MLITVITYGNNSDDRITQKRNFSERESWYLLRLLLLVVDLGLHLVQLSAGRQVAGLRVGPRPLSLLQQSLRLLELLGQRLTGLHRSTASELGVLQLPTEGGGEGSVQVGRERA